MTDWDWTSRQIARIENSAARARASVTDPSWYALRVMPSCPPDTRVWVRGGRLANYAGQWGTWSGRVYTVPTLVADLTDPDSVTIDITFANPNYYRPYSLVLRGPSVVQNPTASDWQFWLGGPNTTGGSGAEFATASEAEASMDLDVLAESDPWLRGFPICGIIVRNDGTIGAGAHILPVDMVNRGRSYIWPRDIRPRWQEGL